MLDLIVSLLAWLMPADGVALRHFDPNDLINDRVAAEHVWAARIAVSISAGESASPNKEDNADLVLAIAWHESRFVSNVVSIEPNGLVSCGVMTPIPQARCSSGSLVDQYLIGARHLRGWFEAAHGDSRIALLGLTGGYALINACAKGPYRISRSGRELDLCLTPNVFFAIRSRIRSARSVVGSS